MVERGKGGRARTWPEASAAWARRAFPLPALHWGEIAGHRLRLWLSADAAPGRLVPWLAIAYGFGIVLYFTADREPALWAGIASACAGAAITFLVRARPVAFPVALGITVIACGFATGTLRGSYVAHPVLAYPASGVEISGFVELREDRERSDRIVIRVQKMEAPRLSAKLERVRLSVRKGTAPPVGSFVTLKARLSPPLQPLRPGGYDFARDMYFQGLGASGFVLGRIATHPDTTSQGLWLRYATAIANLRDGIDARIRIVLSGDRASIASALITGKRDAISTPVNDAMYVSSLAHVLSISGYHMAVVAGVVFFAIRAGLALFPALASRRPIKKWAAFGALIAAAFYLLLSGAEVATQRSFIMTSVVLIGVMLDRPALTVRTIAVAALIVLLFHPEAIVHPSFQMSFAATLALIAGYERGLPWFSNVPDTGLGARIALWGGREIVGLIVASLLAGLATTLYAAFHFHRVAPYGVLANLLAMPIVSAWVMPAGILAVLALPFGFDGIFWRVMADGIDWMIAVALWVASLPGAVGRVTAFGVGPLLLGSAGLVLVCLLRSPLRWSGAAAAILACAWAALTPSPDVYVSHDGQIAAVRNAQGAFSIVKARNDDFTVREWLAADADKRTPRDTTLGEGTACDRTGCVARLPDRAIVALSMHPGSLEEDCLRAAIVVTPRAAPVSCGALVIDRNASRAGGAIALYRGGNAFEVVRARPQGQDRPWARGAAAAEQGARTPMPASSRDATPRAEDLEADDQ
jgi:competence protein ComEC